MLEPRALFLGDHLIPGRHCRLTVSALAPRPYTWERPVVIVWKG